MAERPVEILVACGSGIASSSVAAEAVKKICKEAGIPVNVHKGTVQTIQSSAKNMDILDENQLFVSAHNNFKGLSQSYSSVPQTALSKAVQGAGLQTGIGR